MPDDKVAHKFVSQIPHDRPRELIGAGRVERIGVVDANVNAAGHIHGRPASLPAVSALCVGGSEFGRMRKTSSALIKPAASPQTM